MNHTGFPEVDIPVVMRDLAKVCTNDPLKEAVCGLVATIYGNHYGLTPEDVIEAITTAAKPVVDVLEEQHPMARMLSRCIAERSRGLSLYKED